MSDFIRLLPENVANQIAAGEVVQRPSSVVKELLENAVDAGSTDIQLIIKDALFDLHTNGFRGEALASIAAISHVVLKTKTVEKDLGTELKINGGDYLSQNEVNTPKGTIIEVKNLFYNIPARRNFLKSNAIETRHIIDAFQRVAFTYPDIAFSLIHNGNEIYNLPAFKSEKEASNFRHRIVSIMGKSINEKLVPINEETDILKIQGFITRPEFAKKKKGEQFFFVNNRFIRNPYLLHAVVSAYEGLLNQGYHPSYFLNLEVPAKSMPV